jgi:hypothetical protein
MTLGVCLECGLVQLVTPPPFNELTPRVGPIIYNEPERHLDDLASAIESLCGATRFASVMGVSYKDASLVARLERKGFASCRILDARTDLSISSDCAGMELIQNQFTQKILFKTTTHFPTPLLFIGRHILEHSYGIAQFLAALRDIIGDSGAAVLEVPDNTKIFLAADYSFLWEEHLAYFTPETLRSTLMRNGFEVLSINNYDYPYENSLVAIIKTGKSVIDMEPQVLAQQVSRARAFGRSFIKISKQVNECTASLASSEGKLAIVGAGHLSAMFINLFNLKRYFSLIVDDNPLKKGRYMPGSGVEIKGTEALVREGISCAILSLSPESEQLFISKQANSNQFSGKYFSIFRLSPLALCPAQLGEGSPLLDL